MGKYSNLLKEEVASYTPASCELKLGSEVITIYAKPVTSLDTKHIQRKHPSFFSEPTMEGMIDMLIRKATDEDGEKAFDLGDKPALMMLNTTTVGNVFRELFGDQFEEDNEEAFEDRVKN